MAPIAGPTVYRVSMIPTYICCLRMSRYLIVMQAMNGLGDKLLVGRQP